MNLLFIYLLTYMRARTSSAFPLMSPIFSQVLAYEVFFILFENMSWVN